MKKGETEGEEKTSALVVIMRKLWKVKITEWNRQTHRKSGNQRDRQWEGGEQQLLLHYESWHCIALPCLTLIAFKGSNSLKKKKIFVNCKKILLKNYSQNGD